MTVCAKTRSGVGFASAPRSDCCQPWARDLVRRHLAAIEARSGGLVRERGTRKIGPPLGRGAFGCVLPLADPNLCLKITSDDEEGPIALYVQKLQEEGAVFDGVPVVAATARVYDVFRFPGDEDYYGIVRERVACGGHDPTSLLFLFADAYSNAWDLAYAAAKEKDRMSYQRDARRAMESMRAHPVGASLGAVLAGFWRQGCPLMDAHRGNLCWRVRSQGAGTRPGQLLLMDFGASDPTMRLSRVGSLNRWSNRLGEIESERLVLLRAMKASIPALW